MLLWQCGPLLAGWAFDYPKAWQIPAARWISAAMKWLRQRCAPRPRSPSRTDALRRRAAATCRYRIALSLLSTGFLSGQGSSAVQLVAAALLDRRRGHAVVLLGSAPAGRRLAGLVAVCFGFLAVFGQWDSAMVTLASIIVAVPIGVAGGLLLGIAAYRSPASSARSSPLLDLMQTMPVFAYLVPILFLFGFGPTAAVVAR